MTGKPKPPTNALSRRGFLSRAAAIGVGSLAAPSLTRAIGANDTIGVGFIGVGGRGSGHVGAFLGGATQVRAVCDPFENKREKNRSRVNGRYAAEIASVRRATTKVREAP